MKKRFALMVMVAVVSISMSVSAQITTTEPPTCEISINPTTAFIHVMQTQQFSVSESGTCNTPCYTWEISVHGSTGSTVSADGLYTAGLPGTDRVTVTDPCNGSISDAGEVNVTAAPDTPAPEQEGSFALIDWFDNDVVILDFSGNVLVEKNFNGIGCCYFVAPYLGGWLVKGCQECYGCTRENWFIWKLTPDGSIENTFAGLGPGPFFTGLTSGDFISGDVYTGVIDLSDAEGTVIDSINVWQEETGWPYAYSRLGDIAGLVSGGFVVPPQGGWPSIAQLYTPYLYYYNNNLELVNKVDITSTNMRLFKMTGLHDGGFVATCADHGTGYNVEYLCWFNPGGELIEKIDVTAELPFRDYMNVFIAGLSDGRVMITVWGYDKVWIYDHPPAAAYASTYEVTGVSQAALDKPAILDLRSSGITAIGGIAGNIFAMDSDDDEVPDVVDNCPYEANPGQTDADGDGIGDACDYATTTSTDSSTTTTGAFYDCMLTIYTSPPGAGTTIPSPPQFFIPGCHYSGLTLEAIPHAGYTFSHWEGDVQGSANPMSVDITGNASITAVFVINPCTLEKIYGHRSKEANLLRNFRDNILNSTPAGQELVKLYYQLSPAIVEAMEEDKDFERGVKELIDSVIPSIEREVRTNHLTDSN